MDYDYAAVGEPTAITTVVPAQRKKIKDDRSPWSPKRRNKKSGNRKNNKNNKKNKKNDKRQAIRTTRRAGTFNDELDDAGQNQLLGLGKPRPLPLPAPQLKPFVSVGVCKRTFQKKKKRQKVV